MSSSTLPLRSIFRIRQGASIPDGWRVVKWLTSEQVRTRECSYIIDVILCERRNFGGSDV